MDHPLPTRGPSTTRTRTRGRAAALLGVLALLVALVVGCSTVEAFTDLDAALRDAGFTDTRVNVAAGDPVALTVSADAPPGDSPEEAQTAAAEVIWTTFPRRFEEARITIDGDSRTVTAEQLQEQFGDRPADLDDQGELADDVNRVGVTVVVGILLTGLVVVAVAGLTALLVVRRRRRAASSTSSGRRAPWAPPPHLGGPPGTPVPPPTGWGDPHGGTAPPPSPPGPAWTPGGPGPADPTGTGPPPEQGAPPPTTPPSWAQPRPGRPMPAPAMSHRQARADARRRGRPPRGPRPPDDQIPRGWG